MDNFIQWGLKWGNALRSEYATSLVKITHIGGTLTVPATIADPETLINVSGVRNQTDHTICIFTYSDVKRVRFNRGVKIEEMKDDRVVREFLVVIDKTLKQEFDDSENLNLIVYVEQCS